MSSQKTITNTDILLSEIIKNILPATGEMDILVGFFYFSGFKGIYKNLINKKVRILVGMDAEISIVNSAVKVNEVGFRTATKSDTIKQLKDIFNKTETLDNLDGLEAVQIYIDKIIDGSLEIRRTIDPNHTKLYLFSHDGAFSMGGTLPGTVISGSSNLTYSGLSGRFEYNTIDRDPDNYSMAKNMFEDIWNNHSISVTNGGDNDDVVKMLKQETWLKLTKPYYCYIRLLSEYFKDEEKVKTPKDLTNDKFNDLEYQIDAIKKGLKILGEHNGVIIADVVGLGKSIIGSTLLGNINKKSLIICPPHLIDGWKEYVKDFDLKAEIFSSGAIEKAFIYDLEDIHKADVVLIDEAHKYRNAETIDYGNLHQICQGKKVILLTATPFNNQPDDIFNLIKLFQIPANSTIHTKKGLINDFRDLQNKYLEIRKEQRDPLISDNITLNKVKKLSEDIRQIIGPVIVRRSRVDLEDIISYRDDLKNQGYEFANVLDPKELNFPLDNIEDLYIETLESLVDVNNEGIPTHFKGARYKILTYLNDPDKYQEDIEETLGYEYALLEGRQKNMPFFIRRLLVSRFESSIYAFKKTLQSIINSIDNVFNYLDLLDGVPVIKKGGLPNFDDICDEDLDVGESIGKIKELIDSKNGILIPKTDLKSSFIYDLNYDREFLKGLLEDWGNIKTDPKLDTFFNKIKEIQLENKDRKIIVFSMFADTIEYLNKNLTNRVLVVTGKHKTDTLKEEIKLNFDAGVDENKQKNDYDILLGTDAISEGYNLHRAGVIINYDIPYNPTKVIQRIGRINRINKKVFDNLYVYNYFPSMVGEELVNTKKISKLKIKMIATVLGVDVKTLSGDEEVSSFYKKAILEDKTLNEDKSWDSEFLNDFKKAQDEYPDILSKIENIPQRTRILRVENKGVKGVLVFAKKKSNLIFTFYNSKTNKVEPLNLVEAFNLFKSNITEEPEEVSKSFYNSYEQLKKEIQNPHANGNMNIQQKKAYENARNIYNETDDNYFKILQDVIRLGGLPLVYMKKIRKVTKATWKKDSNDIKELISEEYLKGILDMSKSFNEETLDLIISEEFSK